jgi:NOL1/NOP2/fmu family ribosome biogenesis protein
LKVLRPGLELGQIKKDRFEPAHALALWLTQCAQMKELTAGSKETEQYLLGNVIPGTQKGWCLVRVDGVSLGWCKGDGSVLKNHYPKGLRRMG